MKNILIKTALILLGVMSVILIASNLYMFAVTTKLSEAHGLFEKYEVVVRYRLFHNTQLCAYASLLTIVILIVLFYFLIKEFVINNKKIYYLKDSD
jgi:hypothetical protein